MGESAATVLPAYCGAPPGPGEATWNADPWLIGALVLVLLLGGWRAANRGAFAGGVGVLAAGLLSPLCSLAVALFSVRVAQHMFILFGAVPLLALGLRRRMRPECAGHLALASAALAAALWVWHLPGPYALTFTSHLAWWAMHGSLLGAGLWLARALLDAAVVRPDAALIAGLVTAAQMGALGAFLTFAPRPLFWPHAFSTFPWGLAPIEDQQLGGLIMWVPGGIAFAALALAALARALREPRAAA